MLILSSAFVFAKQNFPSCRTGMGRGIVRLIQSLNEKAVGEKGH